MAKRRQPPAIPSIVRTGPVRKPKVEFVIACEGKATEPEYLKACVDYYGLGSVRLRVLKERGVPLTVVRLAIAERERLMAEYRGSPDSVSYGFVVWAVFDRDEHPQYDEAIKLAIDNKIMIAVSNPCFELWPYLHYVDCNAHTERDAMHAALAEIAPPYHHKRNPIVDFTALADRVADAEHRAKELELAADRNGTPYGNPTTGMYGLVRHVINNGRRQPQNS
jgi:hypothetical protein